MNKGKSIRSCLKIVRIFRLRVPACRQARLSLRHPSRARHLRAGRGPTFGLPAGRQGPPVDQKMINGRTTSKLLVLWGGILVLVWGIFNILAAGDVMKARFRTRALIQVLKKYHQAKGAYPETITQLPKFFVVSANEGFYLDEKLLSQSVVDGYGYGYSRLNPDQFVLSVSPVGWLKRSIEFGITQEGILKQNKVGVDSKEDSYQEVSRWKKVFQANLE